MKPFFKFFLCFLISLGQARDDLVFHDEGDSDSYPVTDIPKASEKMNKLQVDDDMKASDVEIRNGIEKERGDWIEISNACLYTKHKKVIKDKVATLEECKVRCIEEKDFFCQSIGFVWNWCSLSNETRSSPNFETPCRVTPKYIYAEIYYDPVKPSGFPYVGEDCCNLSTTHDCKKIKGTCIPRNETCFGYVYYGTQYCVISNLKSCKCCVSPEPTTPTIIEPTTTTTKEITTTTTAEPTTTTTDTCIHPFTLLDESKECFFASEEQLSWDDARNECQTLGGDIATPTDFDALKSYLGTRDTTSVETYYYVGANDRADPENKFHWINGEPVTGPWLNDQEPHFHLAENCLVINADINLADTIIGCGSTTNAHFTNGYICQII